MYTTKNKITEPEFIMLPSVDFCFQELMEDETIRRGFISAILDVSPEEITSVELLPKKLRKKHKEDKYGILDVRARLRSGEQINIEMQSVPYDYWQERSLFYLGKMYVDQIHEGEDTHRDMYTDKFEIHILELPKLAKYEYPQTELLRWAQFFGSKNRREIQMLTEKDEYIRKAYDKLEEISADEEKRLLYEERQKAIRDHRHMIASGRREGLREGRCEGLREGKREGLQQINQLNQKLIADGRTDDLIRACSDEEFQKKLLEEYGLQGSREKASIIDVFFFLKI